MSASIVRRRIPVLGIICSALTLCGLAQSATIDIMTNNATAQVFEEPSSDQRFRAIGQVFSVPAPGTETRLTELRFEFGGAPSGFDYRVFVYPFNEGLTRPTGTALYSSGAMTANAAGTVTLAGLIVDLQAGTDYIAFLTTQSVVNDATTGVFMLTNNTNPYAGGDSWRLLSTSASDTATSEDWSPITGMDMDFFAAFEAPNIADLTVTIDDERNFVSNGDMLTYTIAVDNLGPRDVTGASVEALIPGGLVGATWVCVSTSGADCSANGTGDVLDNVDLDAGASVLYAVDVTVQGASEFTGIDFSAQVLAPASPPDPTSGNNSDTDSNAVGLYADGMEVPPDVTR